MGLRYENPETPPGKGENRHKSDKSPENLTPYPCQDPPVISLFTALFRLKPGIEKILRPIEPKNHNEIEKDNIHTHPDKDG